MGDISDLYRFLCRFKLFRERPRVIDENVTVGVVGQTMTKGLTLGEHSTTTLVLLDSRAATFSPKKI